MFFLNLGSLGFILPGFDSLILLHFEILPPGFIHFPILDSQIYFQKQSQGYRLVLLFQILPEAAVVNLQKRHLTPLRLQEAPPSNLNLAPCRV